VYRQIASTGDVIDGRYRIEARLGKGGFARVYRAVDFKTGRPVALKLLRGGIIEDTTPLVRFMKEGNILARLGAHPNVIQVYDAGLSEDEDPFIAMELLEGLTLTSYIRDAAPVAWDEALGFMSQVADGLEHAHAAGIIHRDLKPGNILLTEDAHGVVIPKLVDFGIAKVLETAMDQSVTRVGTPAYCAPEQLGSGLRRASSRVGIKVARGLSPATDVWPFGLITYELLTGLDVTQYWGAPDLTNILMKSALEPREKPSKVAGDQRIYLPPEFDEWFMRCLEPNAEDRFKTPAAAVDALAGLLDLTVDDVPTLGPESPQLRAAERELLAIALAAADKDAAAPTIPRPDLAKHRIVMDSTTTEAQDDESTGEVTQPRGPRDREPSLPGITLDDDAAAEAPPVPQSVGRSSEDDAPVLERKRVDPVSEELSWGMPEGDDSPGDTPFSEDLLARLALDEESETPPSVPPTASGEPGETTGSDDAPPVSSAVPSSLDGGESGGGSVPAGVAEPSSGDDEDSGDRRADVAPATERMALEELDPPTEVMAPEEIEPPTRRLPSKSRRSSSMVPYAIGAMLVGGVAAMVWDRVTAGSETDPSRVDAGAPAATASAPERPTATAGPTVAPPPPSLLPPSTAEPTADPSAEPEPPDEDQPEGVPIGPVPEAPPDETAEPSAEPPPPPPPPRPRWRPPLTKYVPPGI